MRLTRRGEVVAALLLALPVSAGFAVIRLGSGGSSGASPSTGHSASPVAYMRVLQRIASEEAVAQQRVADAFRAKKVQTVRAAMRQFEADQAALAAQVAALMPPANAVATNRALAYALADSVTATHSLISRIAHAKSVAYAFDLIQTDRATHQVGKTIGAALAELKELGYFDIPQEP